MQQRLKERNSQNLLETDVHHDGIPSTNYGYRLCPTQPSHEYQQENFYHRLLGIEIDWEQRILPTVQQEAMRTLS